MRKLAITTLLFGALVLMLPAHAAGSQKSHSLGFAAGPTYGGGIAYNYTFEGERFGLQVVLTPPYINSESKFLSGGATFFYNFGQVTDWAHPYISFGAGMIYRQGEETYYTGCEPRPGEPPEQNCIPQEVKRKTLTWGGGVGPAAGIRLNAGDLLSFNIEVPCAVLITDDGFKVLPIPNVGVHVKF